MSCALQRLALVALLLLTPVAHAASSFTWPYNPLPGYNDAGTTYPSAYAACVAGVAGGYASGTCTTTCTIYGSNTSTSAQWSCNKSGGGLFTFIKELKNVPWVDPCAVSTGKVVAIGLDAASALAGGGCHQGCKVTRSLPMMRLGSGDFSIAAVVGAGTSCAAEPPVIPANCFVLNGVTMCAEFDEAGAGNTGKVSVGTDKFRPEQLSGCKAFGSGGLACVASGAGAAPTLPNDGDPVTPAPATPNATITYGGKTINYYSSTVVSNATNIVTTGDGSATGAGEAGQDEDEGSVSGGTSCAAEPVCDGDAIACAMVAQQWRTRCPAEITEGDIEGAVGAADDLISEEVDVGDISASGPLATGGGSCPGPITISYFGESFEVDIFGPICMLLGMLAPIVMSAAYLAAVFIVMAPRRAS